MELTSTVTIKRDQEEADNILAHQMVVVASEENKDTSGHIRRHICVCTPDISLCQAEA